MTNSYNLQEIDQEQATNLCRFYINSGQNMLMLGRRGVGKTSIGIQSAKECGFKVNPINLAVIERSDLMGFPKINDSSDVINYKYPYYFQPLKEGKKPDTIILFDEIDKCPSEITAPLLEILQFKTINGKPLNIAGCVLTGNLINEGAYSNAISSAILDRCAKYVLSFSFEKWIEWARINDVHDLILGFLMSNQDLACGQIESTLLATPSPRGWHYASNAIIQARKKKITDIDTIVSIIAGFVGLEAALKFEMWYKYSRDFEKYIMSLIENGVCEKNFEAMETTEQLVFSIMTCYLAKSKILNTTSNKRIKYLDNICKFFIDNDVPKEIQLVALGNAFPFEVIADNKLYESKSFHSLVSDLRNEVIKMK